MIKTLPLAVVAAALLAVGQASAAADDVSLTTAVFKEVETKAADGHVETTLKPAGRVVPGDQVVYVLTYHNGQAKPSEGVVVTNPLPQGLVYAGPADARPPLVSVDGKTFDQIARLTANRADGARAPAALADISAVRWTLPQAVPSGGEVRLAFRARLK